MQGTERERESKKAESLCEDDEIIRSAIVPSETAVESGRRVRNRLLRGSYSHDARNIFRRKDEMF